ncbi:hypothetical protein NDA13_003413 [Ustilago tritici]|nr:hypothetical protein NDA13_003413 [Ustilago tritici]
MHLFYLPAA